MLGLLWSVITLQRRLRSLFSAANTDLGITPHEATVLGAVMDAPLSPTVPQIGRILGHPRQAIQRAANRLLEVGLIETAPNPHHKRAPLLIVTEAGRAIKARADGRALALADDLLKSLDPDQCLRAAKDLRAINRSLMRYLEDRGASKDDAD